MHRTYLTWGERRHAQERPSLQEPQVTNAALVMRCRTSRVGHRRFLPQLCACGDGFRGCLRRVQVEHWKWRSCRSPEYAGAPARRAPVAIPYAVLERGAGTPRLEGPRAPPGRVPRRPQSSWHHAAAHLPQRSQDGFSFKPPASGLRPWGISIVHRLCTLGAHPGSLSIGG